MGFIVITADLEATQVAGPYDTGEEANVEARRRRAETGIPHRVAREADSAAVDIGVDREVTRMRDGTYKPLPEWFPTSYYHFAHFASTPADDGSPRIAYSPTSQHIADDRQVVVAPGRYLQRTYPHMSSQDISALVSRLALTGANLTFEITTDKDVLIDAYIADEMYNESSRSESCMRGNFGLSRRHHPCTAYHGSTSTFAICVARYEDGTIAGRALVGQRNKVFVRVYGGAEPVRRGLIDHLESEGYTRASSFCGERLVLREHPEEDNCWLLPYVDGDVQYCDEDGRIGSYGHISLSETSGAVERDDGPRCENCGEHARDTVAVYIGRRRTQEWCEHCVGDSAFHCDHAGEYVSADYADSVEVTIDTLSTGGFVTETWSEHAANDDAFWCDATEKYYAARPFTAIDVQDPTNPGNIETWCADATDSTETDADGEPVPSPEWLQKRFGYIAAPEQQELPINQEA